MNSAITAMTAQAKAAAERSDALIDGLQRLAGMPGAKPEPFAGLKDFAAHLHSHTNEAGEVKLGGHADQPSLNEFKAAKALGMTDQLIPSSIGVPGREREIRSGDLVIHVTRSGSDEVESAHVSFLNEDDARKLSVSELDAPDGPVTTLDKLAQRIDDIPGLSARLEKGRLRIDSAEGTTKFSIEDQGTGLLKELGGENIEVRETFDRFVGTTFFGQMLKAMRKTVHEPAYFYGGKAEETFRNQLDAVLAEELTRAGNGEYSEALYRAQFNAEA